MSDQTLSVGADFSEVFSAIDQVGAAFDQVVSSFQSGLADAVASLGDISSAVGSIGQNIDVTPVTAAITEAVQTGADTPVDITQVDAGEVTSAIDAAESAADTQLTLFGDATEVTSAIDTAVASSDADQPIALSGDASEVTSAIDDAVANSDAGNIQIEADTSSADSAISDLNDTATGATSSVDGLGKATSGLGIISGVAGGEVSKLGDAGELLGSGAGAAAGLVTGLGGAIAAMAEAGITAAGAQQRFNSTFGDFTTAVNTVHITGLNTDLETLGLRMGSTKAATQDALATIGNFFRSAGDGGAQVADLSQKTFLLAANAVALRPSLGSVADVAADLPRKLGAGTRAFAQLNLSVSQNEITQQAFHDTNKTTTADLTRQERATAAVEVAWSHLKNTLGSTVTAGFQNVVLQQKSVVATFQDTFEELGKPLAIPFLATLQAAIPIVQGFGTIISGLGQAVLPALAPIAEAFGKIVGTIADQLKPVFVELQPALAQFGQAFGQILVAVAPLAGALVQPFLQFLQVATPIISIVADLLQILQPFVAIISSLVGAFTQFETIAVTVATTPLRLLASGFNDVIGSITHFLGPIGGAAGAITDFAGGAVHAVTSFLGIKTSSQSAVPAVKSLGDQIRSLQSAQDDAASKAQQTAAGTLAQDVANKQVSRGMVDLIAHQLNLNSAQDDYSTVLAHVNGLIAITGSKQKDYTATLIEQQTAEAGVFAAIEQESSVRSNLTAAIGVNAGALRELAAAAGAGVKLDPAVFTAFDAALGTAAGNSQKFFDLFKSAIDGAVKTAQGGIPQITDVFKKVTDAAGNVDLTKLQKSLQDTLTAVTSFTKNFQFLLSAGFSNLAQFGASQGPQALQSIVTSIFQDPGGVAKASANNLLLGAVQGAITTAQGAVQAGGPQMAASINGWGGLFGPAAQGSFGQVVGAAQQVPFQVGAALTSPEAIASINASASILGQETNAQLQSQLANTGVTAAQAGAAIGPAFAGDGIPGSHAAGAAVGGATVAGTGQGLIPLPATMTGAATLSFGAFLGLYGNALDTGGRIGGALDLGVYQGIRDDQAIIDIGVNNIRFASGGAIANALHAGVEIGAALDQGIAAGIRGSSGQFAGAASQAVGSAIAAAKLRAGISSPSKVFAEEVGVPIAQGIALGITQGKASIASALDLTDLATTSVTGSPKSALTLGSSQVDDHSTTTLSVNVDARGATAADAQAIATQVGNTVDLVFQKQQSRNFTVPV